MAARSSSSVFFNRPIVVILGATGTGKSKLAIEIAKKFKGEIISSDAMQMYKGLDIATNKVTLAEQEGVPHHLLGFLDPMKKLTVCEFRNYALSTIKSIINREKVPVIVGGTHYYIESILYNVLLSPLGRSDEAENKDSPANEEDSSDNLMEGILPRKKMKLHNYENLLSEYEKLDNEKLHEKLGEVDPETAKLLHPNNRRKILRALMVYEQFGEPLSSLLNKQRSLPGGCNSGGPLRFTNSIILWLKCDFDILIPRLDARVDGMLQQGLMDELLDFHKRYNEENLLKNESPDYTKGVFQSIGFKEFHEYLIMNEERRKSEEGQKLFERGIELLKIATRQYAKRQCKWIRNRFLKDGKRQLLESPESPQTTLSPQANNDWQNLRDQIASTINDTAPKISARVPPIYELDTSDLSKWKENVSDVAEEIVKAHIAGIKPSVEPSRVEGSKEIVDKTYKCEICQKILLGTSQWEVHLKSAKHARALKRKNRMEKEKQT